MGLDGWCARISQWMIGYPWTSGILSEIFLNDPLKIPIYKDLLVILEIYHKIF